MEIKYEARFEKDLKKIKDVSLLKRVKKLIYITKKANSILDMSQIKKLKGHNSYYRFKIGNYRIGFEIVNEIVIFTRVLHRKDIYRYFP